MHRGSPSVRRFSIVVEVVGSRLFSTFSWVVAQARLLRFFRDLTLEDSWVTLAPPIFPSLKIA
jgi:hypothetical protein